MKGRKKIETSVKTDLISNSELTVDDFISLHIDFMRDKMLENLAHVTIQDHKNIFKFFVRWLKQTHWFDENQHVGKTLFLEYKEYLIFERNYAPCTVNVRLRPLRTYINWLLRNHYITTDYTIFLKLVRVPEDRVQPLSKTEVRKLINVIGNYTYARFRDLALTICILDCGIRIGELLQLTYFDINFTGGYIVVRAEVSKTRTERILPVSKKTLDFLQQLKDITVEQKQIHLFLSTTGKKVIAESDIFTNFRKYKKEANITKKCTPYVLRHTFATGMVKKGVDIFTLQKMMGHKNITTTRQYVYLGEEDILKKHKEIDILSDFLKQ